ncbi:hypothetical protein [Caballeronia sp. LjRoot31]|uniref:hypothetical protein n=1 Tax=Caballeronia sp. LjRoot31 TaxID=3342324 RepID=UPI003F501D7B
MILFVIFGWTKLTRFSSTVGYMVSERRAVSHGPRYHRDRHGVFCRYCDRDRECARVGEVDFVRYPCLTA